MRFAIMNYESVFECFESKKTPVQLFHKPTCSKKQLFLKLMKLQQKQKQKRGLQRVLSSSYS